MSVAEEWDHVRNKIRKEKSLETQKTPKANCVYLTNIKDKDPTKT